MEMLGMYASSAATANNVAQMQVPRAGTIRGIQWLLDADLDGDGDIVWYELSFLPVFQATSNNTRNLICTFGLRLNLTTSGSNLSMAQGFYPLNLKVTPLQIIYVNTFLTGATVSEASIVLHFD